MSVKRLLTHLHLPVENLPVLSGATEWLNTTPLLPPALHGKVVVVDFWTYTCINWIRTLPYIRAWAETYGAHGLVVIGVHTPEFGVEHDVDNVRRAARRCASSTRSQSTTTTRSGCVRESVLARALRRRCGRPNPAPPLRRRR